jgi:uncharacterized protein (DUF1684 family)
MNQFLFLAGISLLLSSTAHAQAPVARPDSATHRQGVVDFQQTINTEFHDPKESPLTPAERQAFKTLPFYPIRYAYCVEATLVRDSTSAPFAMATSTARRPLYRKYGELRFVLKGQALRLTVYQDKDSSKQPGFEDYLFVPFTDLTNGHETYGGGRYLDLRIPPAGARTMVLDFNKAYNPSCAYNHGYSCPVPPAENRLAVAIPVGVQSGH